MDATKFMLHVCRLRLGQDLKSELLNLCHQHKIKAGAIISSVGCLKNLHLRLAGGSTYLQREGDFEIISLNGTLSQHGAHLHLSVADNHGHCLGGHLLDGCLINTTAEIVVIEFKDVLFKREFDAATGYKELVVEHLR